MTLLNEDFHHTIMKRLSADALVKREQIQSLWSGYGEICRYEVQGGEIESVMVKHVALPELVVHPRGWHSEISHARKIKSYQVESHWYRSYSSLCDSYCRVPVCYGEAASECEYIMVMEDLDASGYGLRKTQVSFDDMAVCLRWLANFHARFMGMRPNGLWEEGTYWHLATRPDELEALEDRALKVAAPEIDRVLKASPYQTLVHGDAKLANFCFTGPSKTSDKQGVAAVDFQYVGGGCGMKDVAYFIGSCLGEEDCERSESVLLDVYFTELASALALRGLSIDVKALERDWRELYPVAWTDFHRFLKGWSPGHWKIHDYSERLARSVLKQLGTNRERH